MKAGASGYLLKGAESAEIDRAVRAVAGGEAIFSPAVADQVLGRAAAPARTVLAGVTPRELQVLDLVARGLGNATIAARLGLSPKTVGNHVSALFGKLGVATRAEAVVRARAVGRHPPHPHTLRRAISLLASLSYTTSCSGSVWCCDAVTP